MKLVGDRTMVTIYLDVGVKRRKEFKSRVGKEEPRFRFDLLSGKRRAEFSDRDTWGKENLVKRTMKVGERR